MKKAIMIIIPAMLVLAACTEEATAPTIEDDAQDQGAPVEVIPNENMPEGEVQDEAADPQFDQKLSEEDANAALDALEAEEAGKTAE